MVDVVLLHAFSGHAPAIRQGATWSMLEELRRHGRHIVVDWPCVDEDDYFEGIASCWRISRVLTLLEHDVEASPAQLVELEACTHPVCVLAYQLHPGSTGLAHDVWSWRNAGEWGHDGDHFAELFSFGCVSFKPAAQEMTDPLRWPHDGWQNIDLGASRDFHSRGVRAHIHWPAAAHHHH